MNLNPQTKQIIKSFMTGNPQQLLNSLVQQNSGNPILNNLLSLTNSNNTNGIEQLARSLCKTKGINADEMINDIKSLM